MSYVESKGEKLLHIKRLSSLPVDARKVLYVRSEVKKIIAERGRQTPVDEEIIEGQTPELNQMIEKELVHPVMLMLPNVVLKVLASLEKFTFQRIEI